MKHKKQNLHFGGHYRSPVRQIALIGVFAALAVAAGWAERLIPVPVPGARLGLGNGIVLVALYKLGAKQAFGVLAVKIAVAGMLFGSPISMVYSLFGGLAGFACMAGLKKTNIFGVVGVSAAAAVLHNAAQIAVAVVVTNTVSLLYYLPVLIIAGVTSGVVTGVIAGQVIANVRW